MTMDATCDVIVVGAGAAGLSAARQIAAEGKSVVLLEARDRAGGRILTRRDPQAPIPLELGAEFIHGRAEATFGLLRELQITALDAANSHWQRRGDRLVAGEDFSRELGSVMGRLSRVKGTDISFDRFLAQHAADLPAEARVTARMFVEGFDAADPGHASVRALAEEWEGVGDVGEEPQFRLLNGYGELVRALIEDVRAKGVELRLETRVRRLRWERGRVEAACSSRAGDEVHVGRAAVITLPVGLLQLPCDDERALQFDPDVPAKRKAAIELGYGPVVKAIFRFREAFWEDEAVGKRVAGRSLQDAAYLHDADAAWPTWWTHLPLRVPVLTAWAGGPPARRLSGHGEEHLIETALSTLSHVLKTPRMELDGLVEAAWAYDWASDDLARGAYSYVTVGKQDARQRLAEPVEDTVFFAGEATDTAGQAATVAGALSSGTRTAEAVITAMGHDAATNRGAKRGGGA